MDVMFLRLNNNKQFFPDENMASDEQWLKFYNFNGKITKGSQGTIFWSSSESDEDDIILESPLKKRRLSSSDRSEILENDAVQTVEKSPALNSNWKRDSPVLNSQLRVHMSPILVNKHKKCRKKVERKELDLTPLYCTPDLFNSQPSQIIEDDTLDDIPDASQKPHKFELDVIEATQILTTQSSVVIEPVFSQNASIVAEYGSVNSKEMTESTNSGSSPYYIPRKKKKYKKGGLAKRVYNMIQSQSFRCTVWQIYKQNSIANDDTCINCSVKKNWKEYGTTILECSVIGSVSDVTERTILICLSPRIDISLEIGSMCEFFTPFIKKTVYYHNQDVICYINVIKIQQITMT